MKYDHILAQVGGWGKYQKFLCFLLALSGVPNGYFTLIVVFTSRTPEHRCRIPEIDGLPGNDTSEPTYNASGLLDYIPWDVENDRLERCLRFPGNITESEEVNSTEPIKCNHGYVYDKTTEEKTAVTEYDMICDLKHLKPRITSIYLSGVLIGSLLSGYVADYFGRYIAFIITTFLQFVFMLLNIFTVNPVMYAVLMCLAGIGAVVNFIAAVVLGSELIDAKRRAFMETTMMLGFSVGYVLLPLFAYFIVDWKWLMFATGLTGVFFIPYAWLIPESPRWLMTKGKFDKARDILRNIAKRNNRNVDCDTLLSDENLRLVTLKEVKLEQHGFTATGRKLCCSSKKHDIPYLGLFTKPGMLIRTLCCCFSWFVISLIYYAMGFNTGNLGGNDYINCLLSAALEIPAYISVYLILRKKGRRTMMITYLCLSGVACMITPLLGKVNDTAAIVSAMAGKFCVTSVFSLVYLYTTELFPTEARNQGMGISSMCARLGSITSPYLVFLGEQVSIDLLYFITGSFAFGASACNFLLPETKGIPLANTYEEAAQLKRQPILPCRKRIQKDNVRHEGKATKV